MTQGEFLKQEALDSHEVVSADFLTQAIEIARETAKKRGDVTADDVRARLPIPPGTNPSVMGSVFRRGFRCVGHMKSTRADARSRRILVYALEEEG